MRGFDLENLKVRGFDSENLKVRGFDLANLLASSRKVRVVGNLLHRSIIRRTL